MKVDLKAILNKQKALEKPIIEKKKIKVHKLIFDEKNVTNPDKSFDILI